MGILVLPGNVLTATKPERWQPVPGEYDLTIDGAEELHSDGAKTGQPGTRLQLRLKVNKGPGDSTASNGRIFSHALFLTGGREGSEKDNLGKLRELLEAVGLFDVVAQNNGNVNSDWLLGRQFSAHIFISKDYPKLSDLRPYGAPRADKHAAAAQPQQAALAQPSFIQPPQVAPMIQPPAQPQQYYQPQMQVQQAPPAQQPYAQAQLQPQMQYAAPQGGGNGQQMPAIPVAPPAQQLVAVPPPPPGYQR